MIEAAIVVARLLQYLGAAVLFGSSLFFVYGLPRIGPASAAELGWARPLVVGGAVLLLAGAVGGIAAQASLFAGSWSEGLSGEAMSSVVAYMDLGKAAALRAAAAVVALALLFALPRGRARWLGGAAIGAVAAASLAWMGHAAATEGSWASAHLAADALHAVTASAWIGALCVLAPMAAAPDDRGARREALYWALLRFSAVGPAIVAAIVLTGLVNAWVLVGPGRVTELPGTPYGQVLLVKLALFVAMLALAAANRYRFTAAAGERTASVRPLRRSLLTETAAGLAVLGAVAWLGTLPPPSG